MLWGLPWNPAAISIPCCAVFLQTPCRVGVSQRRISLTRSVWVIDLQGTAAYNAVHAFHGKLPDIRCKGITLSEGLPVDGLDSILGVDAEGTSQGSCLATLVGDLSDQARETLPKGKAFSLHSCRSELMSTIVPRM
jgi:hypothetical protein